MTELLRMTFRQVTKNTLWLIFGNIINKILSFLILMILARRLGDIEFGKFSFAHSFVQIFAMFIDMGLGFLIIREVARFKQEASKFISNALSLKIVFSLVVFSVIALSIRGLRHEAVVRILVYYLSLYFVFVSFYSLFGSIFMAYEKMEFNVALVFLEKFCLLGLCIFFAQRSLTLVRLGQMYSLCGILTFLVALGILRFIFFVRPRFAFQKDFVFVLLKEALPIAISNVFVVLYFYINTIILSQWRGDQAVGWYSSAFYLAFYAQLLIGSFLGALFPAMSRFYKENEEHLKTISQKSFEAILAFSLPLSVAGYLLADKIIVWVYGQNYAPAIEVFKVLILSTIFFCLNGFYGHFFVSINKQMIATKISALAVLFNFCSALLLIPRRGYVGAGEAIFLSSATTLIFATVYFYAIGYRFLWAKPILKVIVSICTMSLVLQFVKNLNIVVAVTSGAAVYGLSLFSLRYFKGFRTL